MECAFLNPPRLWDLKLLKTQRHHWECRNVFRTVVKNIQGLVGYIKATRETECNGAEKRVWFHCFQHEVLLPPRSPMTPWKKFVYTCNETNRWVLFNQFSHVASNTCNNAKIRKHTTLALHCENWLFQGKVRQRQICSNNPAIKVALQWNPGGHAQISGEQLRIPCTSGNSHWLQLLQHQKRSKFTSQEHHKNSQKFPPLFLLSKISPGPGKTPWKVEVWASHPAGKIDPKEMTAGGYVLSSDYSMAVPNELLLTGRGILGNGNPPEICFSWTPRQACMIPLLLNKKWQQFTIDMTHYPKNNTSISWPLNFEKFYPFHLQLQLLEQLIPTFLEFDQVWDRSLEGHETANQPTKSCATRATWCPGLVDLGLDFCKTTSDLKTNLYIYIYEKIDASWICAESCNINFDEIVLKSKVWTLLS